jgi:hypothetical protein
MHLGTKGGLFRPAVRQDLDTPLADTSQRLDEEGVAPCQVRTPNNEGVLRTREHHRGKAGRVPATTRFAVHGLRSA